MFVAGFSALLWLIQLWSGLPASPFPYEWPSPQRWFGLGVAIFGWSVLLWWTLLRDGAESIAEAIQTNAVIVKVLIILAVVLGMVSYGTSYIA